jgi:membrane associated rhomboid family serine protease
MREIEQMLQSPVAFFILIITVLTSFMAENPDSPIKGKFIFNAYQVFHRKEWYRLLTSGLVHGGFFHLFLNMLTFYYSAFILEKLMGSVSFAILYFGSQLACGIPDLIKYRNNIHYNALGASGAVSGVLFGLAFYALAFFPASKVLLFFILPIPMWLFPPFFIAFSLLADRYGQDNIGHRAHLAGAIAGAVITILLDPKLVMYVWDSLQRINYF